MIQAPRQGNRNVIGLVLTILAVVFVVVALVVGGLVYAGIKTHGFGLFTIVKASYYPEVVRRVTTDPAFVAALGTPIVVDDAGVSCSNIAIDANGTKATCTLPVSGPNGAGSVLTRFTKPTAQPLDGAFELTTAAGTTVEGR